MVAGRVGKARATIGLALLTTLGVIVWSTSPLTTSTVQRQSKSANVTSHFSTTLLDPCENVLLMGQFNFDFDLENIQAWVQIWSTYFQHIVVVGPFEEEKREALRNAGIQSRLGEADRGMVSPVENLMNLLLEYEHHPTIDAVLSLHDDALLNLTKLRPPGQACIPTDKILMASYPPEEILKERSYYISMRYTIQKSKQSPLTWMFQHYESDAKEGEPVLFSNRAEFLNAITPLWAHWLDCLNAQAKMLRKSSDPKSTPTLWNTTTNQTFAVDQHVQVNNTSQFHQRRFFFTVNVPSDMILMPTKYANLFAQAARPHINNNIFLECSFPTIVNWVAHYNSSPIAANMPSNTRVPVESTPLCTKWDDLGTRGTREMIRDCIRSETANPERTGFGMYHPFKIGEHGVERYRSWLERVQHPWPQ